MKIESTTHVVEAALASVGSKATYTGAGMTLSGWALSSEAAVLIGIVLGVAGLAVNWYYRHKLTNAEIKDLIERSIREHEAHAKLMGGPK